MNLWEFDGRAPELPADGSAWIAPGAQLIGAVRLGPETSIWFNAVLRGDNDEIAIGAGSNVQDGAVLHVDPGLPVRIAAGVTIGHKALIHGCTIG
ncbi:MAG TPA: gamma carbonic anhydrase family protein, partial [Paracoccaceae bacterium]|nr:gamma carbonic anhydrase family protein [Paracoccaceae bacterium]